MVDLKARPFYLDDKQIAWVERTIAGMTDEEKVGQLFIHLTPSRDTDYLKQILDRYHIGGLRYANAPAEEIQAQNRFVQENSKIPLLIASNCEMGGSGGMSDGTYVASAAQCGASRTRQTAYDAGYVSGVEAEAIGCNWNFAPVTDIFFNWRNTIINTRSYSNHPAEVITLAKEFMRGLRQSNVAPCAKHFPGDGTEERDQHLLMGVNDLSEEVWQSTYGAVYRAMIEDDLMSIMVGHICQPALTRKFNPSVRDRDLLPATLSPELLQGLLRGELGFNGVIVTDASHMNGLWQHLPRREQVPRAIAAGCDMFLFFNDLDEDFGFMLDGYQNGIITEERMRDALTRILGMKAALGLPELAEKNALVPPKEWLSRVGCDEHLALAAKAAEDTITLVKDTDENLPITPQTHKRIRLYYLMGEKGGLIGATDAAREIIIDELEKAGFEVTLNDGTTRDKGTMAQYHTEVDAALVFADISGYARENTKRIIWATHQSNEVPWYTSEVPTVFVSLNFTTHLHDVPMVRTYINSYGNTREIIRQTIAKIMGKSEFYGHYNETVWCGKWDTRL